MRAWRRSGGEAYGPYEMLFDANGIVYKTVQSEKRVFWDAVAEVRETGLVILIWINPAHGGLPVPVRMFPDRAQRAAFIAAIREHSTQAKANRPSGSGAS